jgi:hypothetical protein
MRGKYGTRVTNGLAICGIAFFLVATAEFIALGSGFFSGPPSYMLITQ